MSADPETIVDTVPDPEVAESQPAADAATSTKPKKTKSKKKKAHVAAAESVDAAAPARAVSRGSAAKAAFEAGDAELSRQIHRTTRVEAGHQRGGELIKSVVYGAMDGVVTTFAVVSGVVGGQLAQKTVLILGFANMLGDGISMGLGDYISSTAELKYAKKERERELWECENDLESEKQEMIELYSSKEGIDEAEAKIIVDIISKNKNTFVDIMMVEELGLMPPSEDDKPWKNGLTTFAAFCVCGVVPLLPYIADVSTNGPEKLASTDSTFAVSIVLAALVLFSLGAITSKFTPQSWISAGLFTLLNGGIAAFASFIIAYLVERMFGVKA